MELGQAAMKHPVTVWRGRLLTDGTGVPTLVDVAAGGGIIDGGALGVRLAGHGFCRGFGGWTLPGATGARLLQKGRAHSYLKRLVVVLE